MWLFIKPIDVLIFREAKSFTAGEASVARSIFPPSPNPFVGALRTQMLSELLPKHGLTFDDFRSDDGRNGKLAEIRKMIGGVEDYGQLQIAGPLLGYSTAEKIEPFFQPPLDLLKYGDDVVILKPVRSNCLRQFDYKDKANLSLLWTPETAEAVEEAKLVPGEWFHNYLADFPAVTSETRVHLKELWGSQIRFGIKLSPEQKTAQAGMFYQAEFTCLKEENGQWPGFLIEINQEIVDWINHDIEDWALTSKIIALGGEGRAAILEPIPETRLSELNRLKEGAEIRERVKRDGRFKLYLATPAIFENYGKNGWLPNFIGENDLTLDIGAVKFKLVSAAVGKAVPVGGWDLANNRPKPLLRAVPPGSIYFFERADSNASPLDDQTIDKLFSIFHFRNLHQTAEGNDYEPSSRSRSGFGLSFIGAWNYLEEENNV